MAQKYNPLLKFGFQEIGGGGGGEAEQIAALQAAVSALQTQAANLQTAVNTLKSNKITKCFSESDFAALDLNEIFEWQGETTENFTNGYFYKISSLGKKIMPGDNYIHIVNDYWGGIIKSGDYYPIAQSADYIAGRVLCRYPQNGNYYGYCLPSNNYKPVVDDVLFDYATQDAYGVVSVENNTCTLENGDVVDIDTLSYQNPTIPMICNSVDGFSIVAAPLVTNPSNRLPLVFLQGVYIIPIVLEPYTEWQLKTAETEIILPPAYVPVEVQSGSVIAANPQSVFANTSAGGKIQLVTFFNLSVPDSWSVDFTSSFSIDYKSFYCVGSLCWFNLKTNTLSSNIQPATVIGTTTKNVSGHFTLIPVYSSSSNYIPVDVFIMNGTFRLIGTLVAGNSYVGNFFGFDSM